MLSPMLNLSVLLRLVHNHFGVFIDVMTFFRPPSSVQNHETACSAATTSRLQVSVRRSHSAVVPPRCVPAGRVGTEPSWRLKQGDHFPALLYTAPNNGHAASHR